MFISWQAAGTVLTSNGIVSFPTDTVYGLAVNPYNAEAVSRLYRLKGRDFKKPLVLMCADTVRVRALVDGWNEKIEKLAQRYWPGALTLVFARKQNAVPENIVAGGTTVGMRIPGNPALLQLLRTLPFPLAVTSANCSGERECVTAQGVQKIFGATIDGIVEDDTAVQGGVPSTVLDVSNSSWKVLRPGPITNFEV